MEGITQSKRKPKLSSRLHVGNDHNEESLETTVNVMNSEFFTNRSCLTNYITGSFGRNRS